MRAKRKLIISMLAIVFVLLAVVATVAITFALTQQTIKTTLNIGYTVEDIDGTASATYTVGGVETPLRAIKNGVDLGNELVFTAADTEDAGNLEFPEDGLALSSSNDNVVIKYTYTNTGDKHFIASMDSETYIDSENMTIEYGIWDFTNEEVKYSEQKYALVVPSEKSLSYWIRISIDNKAKSASFTGDFSWLLSGCDKDELAYETMPSLEFEQATDDEGNAIAGSYSAAVAAASTGTYIGEIIFPSKVGEDKVTSISASTMSATEKALVTSVYIPDSVEKIGANAFEGFTNLETVTFEQNENVGSASAQSGTGLTTIGGFAFATCSSLKHFIIPNTTKIIQDEAFSYSGLVEIEIPDSVTDIWYGAFRDCKNLKSISFGKGFSNCSFNNGEFDNCVSLQEIKVNAENSNYMVENNYLVDKRNGTLCLWTNKKIINDIPSSVTTLVWRAFAGSSVEEAIIPGNVKTSSGEMLAECKNLKKVTIEEGFTTFGDADFALCTSLEEVTIPSTVTNLTSGQNIHLYPTKKLTIRCDFSFDFYSWMMGRTLDTLVLDGEDMRADSAGFLQGVTINNVFIGSGVKFIADGFLYNTTVQTVTFEGDADWLVKSYGGEETSRVSGADLKSPEIAKGYLTNTFCFYEWTKIISEN